MEEASSDQQNQSAFDKTVTTIVTEKTNISDSIRKLTQKFTNPTEIANSFNEFYNYRLYLTELKDTYKKQLNAYNKTRRLNFRHIVDSYKTGRHYGEFKGNISMAPKNEVEREVYYNNDLSDIDYEIEFITSHFNFILDQISMMDKMIFNFDTLFKFKEKY
jgi:hypothetical protein